MQRKSLTMAAMLAAALAVSTTAFAGPKFEELERAVPAALTDAVAISDALVAALGTSAESVRALQRECFGAGSKNVTGIRRGATDACIASHAETMARARKHAAEDAAKINADLGTCRAGASDCEKARDAAIAERAAALAERDAARAQAAAGGSQDGNPGPVDMSAYAATHCPPGFQGRWLSNGEFSCAEPKWSVSSGRPVADASGTSATAALTLTAPPGREGLGQFPAPPPPPEPKGTCDGAGGKLLCYVLPAAAVVIGGLLIADAASDDFNLVTVER